MGVTGITVIVNAPINNFMVNRNTINLYIAECYRKTLNLNFPFVYFM